MSLRLFWDEQFNTACEEYFDVSGWMMSKKLLKTHTAADFVGDDWCVVCLVAGCVVIDAKPERLWLGPLRKQERENRTFFLRGPYWPLIKSTFLVHR